MKKQNMSLATEMLRDQLRRTRFWKAAFIVAFAVVIIDRIAEKAV